MREYYIQNNIGKAKYVVNYSGGQRKNIDGSPFFDIAIFKNKIQLNNFIEHLSIRGYKERN